MWITILMQVAGNDFSSDPVMLECDTSNSYISEEKFDMENVFDDCHSSSVTENLCK